jgi:hypothetical protein
VGGNEGGGRASERCEASDVKDEEGEDAAPPQWTSPPRVTSTESERGSGVSNDGSLQQTGESQERGAGGLQRGQRRLSSREEAPTREKGMPETPMAGEAQTKRASAARGQALRREVFQVGVRGQQHTQAQTKCVACVHAQTLNNNLKELGVVESKKKHSPERTRARVA